MHSLDNLKMRQFENEMMKRAHRVLLQSEQFENEVI
jgi:hypothetical protein